MEPALLTGSVILISPRSSYGKGDIVTWQPSGGGTPITHRIAEEFSDATGTHYQTKGDANESEDAVIGTKQILGKVIFHVPYLGYPVNFAKKPMGFALLILLPSLLIIFDEILNLKREFARRSYEKRRRTAVPTLSPSPPLAFPKLSLEAPLEQKPTVSALPRARKVRIV
jgi:signal peptidase